MDWVLAVCVWCDVDCRRKPYPDTSRVDDVLLLAHKDCHVNPAGWICSRHDNKVEWKSKDNRS
jgi:hypothetical protein